MATIWKYRLEEGINRIEMPGHSRIDSAGLDHERLPCIWARVEPDAGFVTTHTVLLAYTGQRVDHVERHIATFACPPSLIVHVFEIVGGAPTLLSG